MLTDRAQASIVTAMATTLYDNQIDLGDRRECVLWLVARDFDQGEAARLLDRATEQARIMCARDADRLMSQALEGARVR